LSAVSAVLAYGGAPRIVIAAPGALDLHHLDGRRLRVFELIHDPSELSFIPAQNTIEGSVRDSFNHDANQIKE
jgi:hypothetical protein